MFQYAGLPHQGLFRGNRDTRNELCPRLIIYSLAERLTRFLGASVDLMSVLARACRHENLSECSPEGLTTIDRDMAYRIGAHYSSLVPLWLEAIL